MRKALVIFLLAVLPFQFVWGAAAGYCQHEQGIEVTHFGHHAHKHQADKHADDSAEKSKQVGGDDADCIACHMSCATVLSDVQPILQLDRIELAAPAVSRPHSRLVVSAIDRPNWATFLI